MSRKLHIAGLVLLFAGCCSAAWLGNLPQGAAAVPGALHKSLPTDLLASGPIATSRAGEEARNIFGLPNLFGDYFERVVLCHNLIGDLGTSACNSYCVLNNQISGACDENVCICE